MSADQIISSPDGIREHPRPTILHYRRDGLVVTNRYVSIDGDRYAISHLTDLMRVKGGAHRGVAAGFITAAAGAAVLAGLASAIQRPFVWALVAVALIVPSIAGIVCAVRWPPRWELYGRYQDRTLPLFASRDHLEFGKVHRALMRAIEADRSA